MVQLSHLYMTSRKTAYDLCYQSDDASVFNMLSRVLVDVPSGSDGTKSNCNAGDSDSSPESGRSSGEGDSNLL